MLVNGSAVNAVLLDGGPFSSGGGGVGEPGGAGGLTGGRYVNGLDVIFLTTSPNQAVYARVKIADADGVIKDYSTRSGINWVHSVEYSETVDAPIATATAKLWRQVGQKSLAPLKTDSSYNQTPFVEADLSLGTGPAIDAGRIIIIDTATIPQGTLPSTDDWHRVFEGTIDSIDWSQNPIVIEARDKGAALADTWFPVPNTIIPDPANIQGALAELLDLGHLDTVTPLYVPVLPDPEVVVGGFSYAIEPVLDALLRVSQINGWDLRHRFIDIYQEFRLTFKDPGRGKETPDFFFDASMYRDVTQLKIDRTPIRNDVSISFRPGNDTGVDRVTVSTYDPESVRRYGRRSMVIQEADDSPINSSDSALLMAQLIVYDLAQPMADKAVDMPYFWPLEIHNLIQFEANLVHSDEILDLFVVGLKHVITDTQARSFLTLRGTPGSYYRWLARRPVVPGGGVPTDPDGDAPVPGGFGNLSQTPDFGTDHVDLNWGWGGDPTATFDVYTQLGSGGFTPTATGLTSPTYDFDTGTNIEPFDPITPQIPVTVSFYVIANISGVFAAQSRTSVVSYGFGG